jgi:hypothetical protein
MGHHVGRQRQVPPQFKTERATDRKPFKPRPWSHQRELEALKGKRIDFLYRNAAQWCSGTLVEADQFALQIDISRAPEVKSVLTVFKHDLRAYKAAT